MRRFYKFSNIARRATKANMLRCNQRLFSDGNKGDLPVELAVLTTIMNAEKAENVDDAFCLFAEDALVIRPSGSPIEIDNPADWTSAILKLWGMEGIISSVHGVNHVEEISDTEARAHYTVEQTFSCNGQEITSSVPFSADMVKREDKWLIAKIQRSS
mmetsp:Transcript_15048/g.27091  ORF Transcript_15048/g.27091 Transcript_15048/m.27091 type:complete len:158 (-) Transcript_15048:28-501(-)